MIILDVGCGKAKHRMPAPGDEVIGIDRVSLPEVDVVHDVNTVPWPFSENTFDLIICNHILEHLDDTVKIMEEIWRIGKNGAAVKIRVPYFAHPGAFQDPTHRRFFTLKTFDYFTEGHLLNYYTGARFRTKKKSLVLFVSRPSISRPISALLNRLGAVYERFFCHLFPMHELAIELHIVK